MKKFRKLHDAIGLDEYYEENVAGPIPLAISSCFC